MITPGHFVFLFLLTNDYPVAHIQSVYGLSDLGVYRYPRSLEQQGLIDVLPGNRFQLKIEGRFLMRLHGPLHQLVHRVNQTFFDEVLAREELVPVKWTTLVAEFDVCGRWPLPEPAV